MLDPISAESNKSGHGCSSGRQWNRTKQRLISNFKLDLRRDLGKCQGLEHIFTQIGNVGNQKNGEKSPIRFLYESLDESCDRTEKLNNYCRLGENSFLLSKWKK